MAHYYEDKGIIFYLKSLLGEKRYLYYQEGQKQDKEHFRYIEKFLIKESDIICKSRTTFFGFYAFCPSIYDYSYELSIFIPFSFIREKYVYLDYLYFDRRITNTKIIFIRKRLVNIEKLMNKVVDAGEQVKFSFNYIYLFYI